MTVFYWDFDGTLVHSGPLWSSCVWRALQEADSAGTVTFEQIRAYMAHGFPWHTPDTDHTKEIGENWWAKMYSYFCHIYFSLGVPVKTAQKAAHRVRAHILNPANYVVYEDAQPVLQALKARGDCHILLSNNHPDLEELMRLLGLAPHFDGFVVSGVVGYDKPRREIFDLARQFYPDAYRHIMVGDSLKADVYGGKEAGMQTVLVHSGFHTEAHWCFDALSSILNVF